MNRARPAVERTSRGGGLHRTAAVAAASLALALAASDCAKREAPSGGPLDIEPPRVVSADPDSGTAGVARSRPLSLTFSEPMEPRSTEQAVSIAPYQEIARHRWHGRTLSIVLAESLAADHTYTLFVGGTARDRHNNPMGTGATIVFSTADRFPRGRIEGRIEARGFQAPGTHLWCYRADRTGVPDSTARDYDAIGFAREAGQFRIDGLAVPGRYRLWGFADLNRNRSFEPEVDVLAPADTVLTLSEESPVAVGVSLLMVNPRAPGRARGEVRDSLADSTTVLRILARSVADSSRYAVTGLEEGRKFDLQLSPGVWRVVAFVDLDNNRQWKPDREPASPPIELTVAPAAEINDLVLEIRRSP